MCTTAKIFGKTCLKAIRETFFKYGVFYLFNMWCNENNRWNRNVKKKKKKTEKDKVGEDKSYIKRVRAKWFCCAFKLGFHQLICKTSLIFKSNLELALSIILKQRKLYVSNHAVEECRCLKISDLSSFLKCSWILVLK